jgi:hypothetical protein
MKSVRIVRGVMVSLATLGLCMPHVAFAVELAPAPAVVDVALADGGVLHGQVVNLQGAGIAGTPVTVKAQNHTVAATTTATNGTFGVKGLRGGVYQVATVQGQGIYRLWTAGTAPPAAQNTAVVYSQNVPNGGALDANAVVYAQGAGGMKMLLANPIVIAGIIATAVAVPVALANSHHGSP